MLNNFSIFNFDKREVLVLRPHAGNSKFAVYIVTLDGFSVSPCAALKDRGVIIDTSHSFETN